MNDKIEGGWKSLPPYWLRRVGLLAIPLMAVSIGIFSGIISIMGSSLLAKAQEQGTQYSPTYSLTAIVFLGKMLSDFWPVWFLGLAVFYGGWVLKRFSRILWFNAIFAVIMPLFIIASFVIYMQNTP